MGLHICSRTLISYSDGNRLFPSINCREYILYVDLRIIYKIRVCPSIGAKISNYDLF